MLFPMAVITLIVHIICLLSVFVADPRVSKANIKLGALIICLPPIIMAFAIVFGGV